MKEISMNQKVKVIKLFLSGLSYDEISQQVGVAKGSVVNIINEFREGYIPLPPGITEFVDELRKLVIDMKKHDTSVAQLKGYVKLHAKLHEMGVDNEKVSTWLDICQSIATSSVTNQQFVQSALELAELISGNGKSPSDVITEYTAKLDACLKLDKDIAHRKDEKKQATATLDSINKAIDTAQDLFQKQKQQLKSQLDEYMVQNKLSWKKVNTALVVLNVGLLDSGLGQEDIKKVSSDIVQAGSLTAYIKQHESEKAELETKVNQLSAKHQELEASNTALCMTKSYLTEFIQVKNQEADVIFHELQMKTTKLAEVEHFISGYADIVGLTNQILGFLISAEEPTDDDIEQLTRMFIFIRQARLGMTPDKYKYIDGGFIYEFPIPPSFFMPGKFPVDIDTARKHLATILVPLVQNKFMPKWEWDSKQLQELWKKVVDMYPKILSLLIQQK
jgi:transposase